jgi:galactose-1-phosphate uridylyltransferase
MFCFGCGLVGHSEDKCNNNTTPLPEGAVNPRGPWLRSNIYGKRVIEKRDKRFNSNPLQSASGGQFSEIPKAMLEMLARMKLEEEQEEAAHNKPTNKNSYQDQDMVRDGAMNKLTHTPTAAKRKFQRTQVTSQLIKGSETTPHQQYLEVSLDQRANQGL